LGPSFSDKEIQQFLDQVGAKYQYFDTDERLCEYVAEEIAQGKVVGWFQGQMEFGPRALGGRSILGDARSEEMQSLMNLKIKFRESFRPFAPSVLEERCEEFFEMDSHNSPYMLLVSPVHPSKRTAVDGQPGEVKSIQKLQVRRSEVPAITHVDCSARVQTVDSVRNARYYKLLKAFEEKTGCPIVINTSFNVRGEPIVCTPENAHRCFMATNMDILVLERHVLRKEKQPGAKQYDISEYLERFQLD
jgi:carbamoyltransferase